MGSGASKEDFIGEVNILEATSLELEFLAAVDRIKPQLYDVRSLYLQNAMRRYETLWLPLIIKHANANANGGDEKGEPIVLDVAPLDIHWIWHTHMLCPLAYDRDVRTLGATCLPPHALYRPEVEAKRLVRVREIWERAYPGEPFLASNDPNYIRRTIPDVFLSRLSYNVLEAVSRQQMFYYQVSLPHYRKSSFLKEAIRRYGMFLKLKRIRSDEFLVPCYDFDLVWHAHQQYPEAYARHTREVCGRVLNHDDSVNDRSEGSKLVTSDEATRKFWMQEFRENFAKSGCMWRGDPPHTWMSQKLLSSYPISVGTLIQGTFTEAPATLLSWAWRHLHFAPDAGATVVYGIHRMQSPEQKPFDVVVVHTQKPPFSAAFVVDEWRPCAGGVDAAAAAAGAAGAAAPAEPVVFACCHTIGSESLMEDTKHGTNHRSDLPMMLMNTMKKQNKRRSMIVKDRKGDAAVLVAQWEGRSEHTPGKLSVTHFNLRHRSLLDPKRKLFSKPSIAQRFFVRNDLHFEVMDAEVNLKSSNITFSRNGVDEQLGSLAGAFGVAILQSLLQPRLDTGEVPRPDMSRTPRAYDTYDADLLVMAGIHHHNYMATTVFYMECGACGACAAADIDACAGCGASCGGGGGDGGDGGDGGGDGGGCGGGCGGCGGCGG